VKRIPLTQGKFAVVDDHDFEALNKHKWYAARRINKTRIIWYAARTLYIRKGKYRTVQMHQVILPTEGETDHKDGDGLNNQRSNLRSATHAQNQWNSGKTPGCTSRFKGVTRLKDCARWIASIRIDNKTQYLGCFANEAGAARAYDAAARKLFGEFARLNFPAV